jgi:hypothetical protein
MENKRFLNQRTVIAVCGLIMSVLIASGSASAFDDDEVSCIEPWVAECKSSDAACTDCKAYCAGPVFKGQCTVEWNYCGADAGRCPGPTAVWNECACKKKTSA